MALGGISMRRLQALALLIALCATFRAETVVAAEPEACRAVRFADVGWTDITATTALASRVLKGLGYQPETKRVSVPGAYAALKSKSVDVFLGNWMPTMAADRQAYIDDGSVDVLGANLEGAKFTLAVPRELYGAGLRTFSDIALFRDAVKGRIHGIEPGNDGNRLIQEMIRSNRFGLAGFELVESSEKDMLAQVENAIRHREPIVFLGWEPHPMNVMYPLKYLNGGDSVFGPNYGGATVYTNARAGYASECANAGSFIRKLKFNLDLENTLMRMILNGGRGPAEAAELWLKSNAATWAPWVEGLTTFDGKPGFEAVKASLGTR
jgi:glycine betaine/proline transport system substrate-binding protein